MYKKNRQTHQNMPGRRGSGSIAGNGSYVQSQDICTVEPIHFFFNLIFVLLKLDGGWATNLGLCSKLYSTFIIKVS